MSLAMGGGAGRNLSQSADKICGGAGIGEGFQADCTGELGRLGAEVNLKNILPSRGHQSIQLSRRILLPVGASGQDHWTGLVDVPFAIASLARREPAVMRAPAMSNYLKVKVRRAIEVGFEGQGLFLFMPAAHQPLDRQRSRSKAHCYPRIFKPLGRKMEPGLHAGISQPVRL